MPGFMPGTVSLSYRDVDGWDKPTTTRLPMKQIYALFSATSM